jgi:hypothetical protein
VPEEILQAIQNTIESLLFSFFLEALPWQRFLGFTVLLRQCGLVFQGHL